MSSRVIAPQRNMALTNFTEDEIQKTVVELSCSAELIRGVHAELIFLLASVNIFLSIAAFFGNLLIFVALHKETSLHPPSKLLYRNLAITDLCVGIITQPLAVTYLTSVVNRRWDICYYSILAVFFSSHTLCAVSLLTLTAISVDRLLALLLGLRYRQVVTLKRTHIAVIGFWIFFHFWFIYDPLEYSYNFMVSTHRYSSVSSHHNLRLHKNFSVAASESNSCPESCCSRTTEPSNSTERSSIQKGSLQCTVGAVNIGYLLSPI